MVEHVVLARRRFDGAGLAQKSVVIPSTVLPAQRARIAAMCRRMRARRRQIVAVTSEDDMRQRSLGRSARACFLGIRSRRPS